MSSLFHRRTRSASASTRPNNSSASNVAHSAAAQAFLANRASNANLSNAAAAAALRTMSPTPTQVGQIRTRRMLQRQNSGSSTGSVQRAQSAPRGRGHPLERQNSGGSMTERTFRTPSPHSPGRNVQLNQPPPKQPPPVPSVPREYHDVPPIPKRSHRRTASMDPQPARVISPPPTNPAGRGTSLDRGANSQLTKNRANRVTSLQNLNQLQPPRTKAPRVTSLQNLNQLERIDSNGSANFSYPGRSRPMSPSPSSPNYNQQATASNAAVSAAASAGILREVTKAAEQPVKKKKKKVVRGAAEGSHLQHGGMGGKPIVTPMDTRTSGVGQTQPPQNASQQTPIVKKKKKKVVGTGEPSQIPSGRPMSPYGGSDSDSTPEKLARRAQRASGQLNKQPSVVREDWEGEQGNHTQLNPEALERSEQGLSPVSSPYAAVQGKKSTGANVSRKIDDTSSLSAAENQRNYNPVTMAPVLSQQPDKNLLRVSENDAPTNRGSSLSPSRSMRFSDRLASDLTAGRKHEPLPRSVSPAKSALKHHSPSPTDPRFPGRYIHSQTASEASDNASNISTDIFTPPARKKKLARVSFDSEPEVVGTAAIVEQTDAPVLASPQNKESGKRGWFGFSKSKAPILGTIAAEDEMEEVMKPRPALPSFGSVRKSGRQNENAVPQHSYNPTSTSAMGPSRQISSTVSSTASESSSGSQIPTMDTSVSSDHAIGGLLAQDAAQTKISRQNEPLPPEVTSVEGTGYISDDGSLTSQERTLDTHKEAVLIPPVETPSAPVAAEKELELVPSISVQPATPGLEQDEAKSPDQWLVDVPGGFPVSTEALSHSPIPELETTMPAGLGIGEPKPAEVVSAANTSEAPLTSFEQQSLDRGEDDVSDGDSIYSDAAEDVSEHGDGFGSINAIVESPMVTSSNKQVPSSYHQVTTPPESPLAGNFNNQDVAGPEVTDSTKSWDQAQAHWSGIAQQSRQGISQPSGLSADEEDPAPTSAPVRAPAPVSARAPAPVQAYAEKKPSIRKKKRVAVAPPPVLIQDSPPRKTPVSSPYPPLDYGREIQPVPPPPPLRSSMRPQGQPVGPHFRSSMRAQPESELPPFRSSMRQRPKSMQGRVARPASPPQPMMRPVSQGMPAPQKAAKQRGALQKKHIPPGAVPSVASTAALKAARPTASTQRPSQRPNKALHRTMSNESDSSSSFKKRHRRGKSSQESYTMRRSMRVPTEPQTPIPAGRGGIRSMSPPRNRRPMSPVLGQKTMRSSMRSPAEFSAPTMRPEIQQTRSSSLFGLSKNKSPPLAGPMPLTKQLRSRFAADSDSDDDGPKVFKSRFEDSSDDEAGPVKYRPVRGIPRKADEGESTDLDDSSADEGRGKHAKSKTPPININTNQGSHFATSPSEVPASPSSLTKKPGFFGRFRSKKIKDETAKSRLGGTIAERNITLERNMPIVEEAKMEGNISAPRKKELSDKTRASRLGFDTVAERDAMLEQTRLKLEAARSEQTPTANGVRRPAPERIMSDSWPLPPKIPGFDEDRPNTSDGVASPSEKIIRPTLGVRQDTSDTARTDGGTPIYGRNGKKKKFPKLRKAFGLVD